MRLHYLRGDRAAALAAFDRCCDVLERTLGVAPDAETEALRARIAAQQPAGRPAQPRPLPVSVLRPPRLIGRDAEWQRLHADWSAGAAEPASPARPASARAGWCSDFAQAEPGALAVDARPGDARVPHTLLSRLLRAAAGAPARAARRPRSRGELAHLLPELGTAAPRRRRRQRALRRRGRVAAAPGRRPKAWRALVVDDLQFADAASVEAMQQLAGAGLGLRWIVAFRAARAGAGGADRSTTACSSAHGARLQVLQPLAAEQVGVLIDSLGVAALEAERLAPALARHTGGNPLFAARDAEADAGASGDWPRRRRPPAAACRPRRTSPT